MQNNQRNFNEKILIDAFFFKIGKKITLCYRNKCHPSVWIGAFIYD
jgi:hypothetical protein